MRKSFIKSFIICFTATLTLNALNVGAQVNNPSTIALYANGIFQGLMGVFKLNYISCSMSGDIATCTLSSAVFTEDDTIVPLVASKLPPTGTWNALTVVISGTDETFVADANCDASTELCRKAYVDAISYITDGDFITKSSSTLHIDAEVTKRTTCFYLPQSLVSTSAAYRSVWRVPYANGMTATEIWCESDGTVPFAFENDDGSATNVDSGQITCNSSTNTDSTMSGGDAVFADGDRLDIVLGTVSGSPTFVAMCLEHTITD